MKAQGEKHNEQTTHSTEHQNHILRYGACCSQGHDTCTVTCFLYVLCTVQAGPLGDGQQDHLTCEWVADSLDWWLFGSL